MPREEANLLAAHRREDVRRQAAEADMYRANPLLYLVNPKVKVGSACGGRCWLRGSVSLGRVWVGYLR